MRASGRLSHANVLAYAAGSFGTGVFSTVPTVLLLYFCTEILDIAPAWAAVLVVAPKLWSIIWDPFVGAWSDRTVTRIGRRRPFLIAGIVGVAVSFVAVFSPPRLDPTGLLVWTGVSYFALATLYSLFAVPYVALPAQIGQQPEERARLVTWRMGVVMIGVLAGAGAAPMLVEAAGGGRGGYAVMSMIIAGACAVAMTGPIFMLRGRDPVSVHREGPTPRLWDQLARALRHGRFRLLIAAYLTQLTGTGAVSAAIPYLVTKALGRSEGDIGVAMIAMLGATTLAVPLWAMVGRRWGEGRALAGAAMLFAAVATGVGVASLAGWSWPLVLALFAVVGLPFGGMQVLPFTLVAHLVHAEAGDAGDEGVFTGVWTATEKLGLALGPSITGLALVVAANEVRGLAMFVIAGPGLLALASLPFLALAGAARKTRTR